MGVASVVLLALLAAFVLFRILKAVGAAFGKRTSRGALAQNAAEDISLATKIVAPIAGLLAWLSAPGALVGLLIKIGMLAAPTAYFLGPVFAVIATVCYVVYAAIKLYRNRSRN